METTRLPFLACFKLTTFLMLASAPPAHAYLDPGTGSYATQIAVAGALGALFSMKTVLRRFVDHVRRRSSASSAAGRPVDSEPDKR